MDSKRLLILIASCLIGGGIFVALFKVSRIRENSWNYSVATSLVDYYNSKKEFPDSWEDLKHFLVAKQPTKAAGNFDDDFLAALGRIRLTGSSKEDFFSGGDIIEMVGRKNGQREINSFIRKRCE